MQVQSDHTPAQAHEAAQLLAESVAEAREQLEATRESTRKRGFAA
jgi:hypothetical protein